jgi:hypothetical protein
VDPALQQNVAVAEIAPLGTGLARRDVGTV